MTPAGAGSRSGAAAAWLWATKRRTWTLLAYGLLAAAIAGAYLWSELPRAMEWPVQGHRVTLLQESLEVVQDGGPPLLVKKDGGPKYEHVLAKGNYPGLFVYVPLLADLVGIEQVMKGVKLLFFLAFLLPIVYYPLVFHRLTGSALAAAASPFLLAGAAIDHNVAIDLYWIMAWASLALLPLVLVAWHIRGRWGLAILAAATLGAGFASSIRGSTGISVLIAAIGVLAFGFGNWSKLLRVAGATALVAVYMVVPGVMNLADRHAVDWAGDSLVSTKAASSNYWHPAYIGLGYQPNEWGIYWLDQLALTHARREDPQVPYLGPGYNEILRELYFDRVQEDPGYVVGITVKKLAVALHAPGLATMLLLVLAVPALLVAESTRRLLRTALLIALPVVILGIVPGLIGIPAFHYLLGSTGAFAFIEIVAWSLLLMAAGRWATQRIRSARPAPGLRKARDRTVVPGLAGAAGVAAVAAAIAAAIPVLAKTQIGPARAGVGAGLLVIAVLVLRASERPADGVEGLSGRTPVKAVAAGSAVACLLAVAVWFEARSIEERAGIWAAAGTAEVLAPPGPPADE